MIWDRGFDSTSSMKDMAVSYILTPDLAVANHSLRGRRSPKGLQGMCRSQGAVARKIRWQVDSPVQQQGGCRDGALCPVCDGQATECVYLYTGDGR
jgi:hypothetical protein